MYKTKQNSWLPLKGKKILEMPFNDSELISTKHLGLEPIGPDTYKDAQLMSSQYVRISYPMTWHDLSHQVLASVAYMIDC